MLTLIHVTLVFGAVVMLFGVGRIMSANNKMEDPFYV